jgi:hypothetical protein
MSASTPGILAHRELNKQEAQAITERIRSAMGDLMGELVKAYLGRVWIALGYESWADYIKGEFGYAPLLLPRDERAAVVALLRGQGMSARAIGAATGVSHQTVRNDELAGVKNLTPEPGEHVDELEIPDPGPGEHWDELAKARFRKEAQARHKRESKTIGTDGKTYRRRSTPKPKPEAKERYPTEDELRNALRDFTSWHQITQSLSRTDDPESEPEPPDIPDGVDVTDLMTCPGDGFPAAMRVLKSILKNLTYDLSLAQIQEIKRLLTRTLKSLEKKEKSLQ